MKPFKVLIAVLMVGVAFAIGFFWETKKDLFLNSTKSKIQQITNDAVVEDKLYFSVDTLNDPELGIKQSLWHQLPTGEKQEIKYTLPSTTIKYRSQYFSDFIKEVPVGSPYKFLYLYDINTPDMSRLMYFDTKTNFIKDVSTNNFGGNSYFFSPDYQYIAVLGTVIQNVGSHPEFNYTNYVDIIDVKSIKILYRHFFKTDYMTAYDVSPANANQYKWTSNFEFSMPLFDFAFNGKQLTTPARTDVVDVSSLLNIKNPIDNILYLSSFYGDADHVFVKINSDTFLVVDGNVNNYLDVSKTKIFTLPENKEQIAVTNSSSPYVYIFDSDHTVTLKKVMNKKEWTIVDSQTLPKSLQESFYGRRDIFVSPDANFAVALNETTGVIIDLNKMVEVKTFDMPKGFMAYANRNGMIVDSVWTAANAKTKWLSPNVFNMELYAIKKTAVTKPSSSMKVDVSEFKTK